MNQKVKRHAEVYILNQKINMRFIPPVQKIEVKQDKGKLKQENIDGANYQGWGISNIVNKIKNYQLFNKVPIFFLGKDRNNQKDNKLIDDQSKSVDFNNQKLKQAQEGQIDVQNNQKKVVQSQRNQQDAKILKFIVKLAPDIVLIGNQKKLDIIQINAGTKDYIETQYLWSIQKKQRITHVCQEQRKLSLLVIVSEKLVSIYRYDVKKFPTQEISPILSINLKQQPIFAQIAKDGNICFFYNSFLEVYICNDRIRKRYQGNYVLPQIKESKFSLLVVPEHFQNYINIFFEQKKIDNSDNTFNLWCIEMQLMPIQIKVNPIQKIYKIKDQMKKTLKLTNYSKQIFLLNLGSEILALKRGYILDSATVNNKKQNSSLEYIGNNTLFLTTNRKIEVYNFSINTFTKPAKIILKSFDSISFDLNQRESLNLQSEKALKSYKQDELLKIIPILSNQYLIILQKKPANNKQKNGQIPYSILITRSISQDQKMKILFPKNYSELMLKGQVLASRCDIAEKMGYTTKQIYLQLWNRSTQSTDEDIKILVATRDYQTIAEQIVKKLKKSSMGFKQILDIEIACQIILREKVFSTSCNYQAVMNYISCHFFKRKLDMFKQIHFMQKEQQKNVMSQSSNNNKVEQNHGVKMSIRQYQFYKNMQIKAQFLQYVNLLCHQNKLQYSRQIRFLLKNFKFVFRMIYLQLLEQIIKNAADNLLLLLKQIPQILPYQFQQSDHEQFMPAGFRDGVWTEISNQQWNYNLYVDKIITIDNKNVILQEVIKSIPFKRNWLSQHDMVAQSIQTIQDNQKMLRSPRIYNFFIAMLFQHIKDNSVLKSIIKHLQQNYTSQAQEARKFRLSMSKKNISSSKIHNVQLRVASLPQNIHKKIFLLEAIYRFFKSKHIVPQKNGQQRTLAEFYDFSDPQLIRFCFQKQRSIKGLLLKDVKQIYRDCLGQDHNQMFNKALLEYFKSDLSQISDLKYLLNRINNQKPQFHRQNNKMYEVLIEALQRKMEIGTNNDIPIDEVLIYLQNIPLHTNETEANPTLDQLKIVQMINKQSQFLRKSKINMSIYEILRNPDQVFTKLIQHAINSAPPSIWQKSKQFLEFSISKLVQVEYFAENIYGKRQEFIGCNFQRTIFFIFLAKICQKPEHIKFAKKLLSQQEIQTQYHDFTVDGLVQFMYKWVLFNNKSKSLVECSNHIRQLLTLIDQKQNSPTYKYIKNELQFAEMLSYKNKFITYPISQTIINFNDIKRIVNGLPKVAVMQIDIERVYEVVKNIQDIICDQSVEQQIQKIAPQLWELDPQNKITLHQIYEIFIVKYLEFNQLQQALKLINKIMSQKAHPRQNYNIVYPILYILRISHQFNERNKQNLIKCVWYYFNAPEELVKFLNTITKISMTQQTMRQYIQNFLNSGKQRSQSNEGLSFKNAIFNEQYLQIAQMNETNKQKFMSILFKTSKHIQQSKQQFKNIKYSLIIVMLCNCPYSLAKFLSCHDQKSVKPIRSVLSYAILQDVFQPFALLQVVRRVFFILLISYRNDLLIENLIQQFKGTDIHSEELTQKYSYQPSQQNNSFESIMWKSAEAFRKKKQTLEKDKSSRISKRLQKSPQNRQMILKKFREAELQKNQVQPSQYIFKDSDNEDNLQMQVIENIYKKPVQFEKFEAKAERQSIFQSIHIKKPCALYKSIQVDFNFSTKSRLFISGGRRGSHLYTSPKSKDNLSHKHNNSNKLIQGVQNFRASNSHRNFNSVQDQFIDQKISKKAKQFLQVGYQLNDSPSRSSPEIKIKQLMKINSIEQEQFDDQQEDEDPKYEAKKRTRSHRQESEHQDNSDGELLSQHVPKNRVKQYELLDRPPRYQSQLESLQNLQLENRENSMSKQQNSQDRSMVSNNYQINIKPDSGVNFSQNLQDICINLINSNKGLDFLQDNFDLRQLQNFPTNNQLLTQLIRQIYRTYVDSPLWGIGIRVIGRIIEEFNIKGINKDLFKVIQKIQQAQPKTIAEISFSTLLKEDSIVKYYPSERQLFDQVYSNIQKLIGFENILKISQFVQRVFQDPKFEQQIRWDFAMNLLQVDDGQQREFNLQKIQVTLPKIDISIWNKKFQTFKKKVLQTDLRDELLQVFLNELRTKKYKQQNKQIDNGVSLAEYKQQSKLFLNNILSVFESPAVKQVLSQIQNA